MRMELKRTIIEWMLNNENIFQRINECMKEFKNYIYDSSGNYIIGGQEVSDFVIKCDKLLYG